MHAAILTEELGWHRTGWAIRLGHCDSISKVFLSDPSGKNADLVSQAVGDKLGGVYSSPEELLKEHKIQMAVVTMAPSRMPDAVLAALEAGANVLVEKPGATSPDAYAPLVELANARGLLLTMALIADSPVVREAAKIVSEGTLGRIYGINYLSMDHQRWRRRHDFGWVFSREQAGGGILGHLACHYLHSMRRILGEELVEVTGFADVVCGEPLEVEDTILLCARFSSGAVGVLHSGYWGPTPYQPVETEVQSISPTGALIMSDSVKPALLPKEPSSAQSRGFRLWGERGCISANSDSGQFTLDLQADLKGDTGHLGEPSDQHVIKRWETNLSHAVEPEGEDPFFQAFLDAVRGECDPPNSNEEGLRFLEIQHALYRASDTGRVQRLAGG